MKDDKAQSPIMKIEINPSNRNKLFQVAHLLMLKKIDLIKELVIIIDRPLFDDLSKDIEAIREKAKEIQQSITI